MKGKNKSLLWMLAALLALALNAPLTAQDDVYYDPATDSKPEPVYEERPEERNNVTRRYDEDDQYYDEDDYAYEYSSRIRRFHRPARDIDYYDPFFVDLYYYDPFFLPGASIYTYGYNDYWAWRRWQRWQRWNAWNAWNPWNNYGWGVGWNSWGGWNVSFGWGGWNAWNNPFIWNNYYYDPYWTWNGCNPYYGNVWVNNNYYYNNGNHNNGYTPQTYTGPRRRGTTVNPGYTRLTNGTTDTRLTPTDKAAPSIDIRPGRSNGRDVATDKPTTPPKTDRVPNVNRKPVETTPGKDPVKTGRGNDQPTDRPREATEPQRPERENAPSRRPTEPTEARPPRTDETKPSRRDEETRPTRRPSEETRPTRRNDETRPSRSGGDNDEARPSRRSSDDRPSRSGNTETRPSRSGGNERSVSPSSSGKSGGNSGSSGRSSSSGKSGGSRGRN